MSEPQITLSRSWWQTHWPLALALVLGLVLRVLIWRGPLHQLANDEIEYVTVARDLLAGRGWVFYEHYHWLRAPLYPLFLAASLWLAGGDLHLAALPNLALSLLNIALAYRLAWRLVGQRAAGIAALITAVLWTNITFASLYMNETLFSTLLLAGFVCLFGGATMPNKQLRHRALWLAAVGVCFGLAALTRSAILPFLPFVALWLALREWLRPWEQARQRFKRAITVMVPLSVAVVLTIAPWTVRNYLAYGRLILVETGLSYNLWAFNEPRESLREIHAALEQITNPADRSDYATERGMARLREDPAILLRKLWPNWVYLTRVKPIEDRFVLESYYLDVALPQFSAALVFDDALYLLIAITGLAGLVWSPSGAKGRLAALATPKALCAVWLVLMIVTMLLTHGEGRYRHFLFPILIPYATWAISRLRRIRQRIARLQVWWRATLFAGITVALLVTFLANYPFDWAAKNMSRGWHQQLGNMFWLRGDHATALAEYERAAKIANTADAYMLLGDRRRASGNLADAEGAYLKARSIERLWIAPAASLGDLRREMGDLEGARRQFRGSYADAQAILDWSWRHLSPAPTSTLDVGNGLDFGYISGVYPAEEQQNATARWTNGHALLRLATPADSASLLEIRLAAPHADPAPHVQICLASVCQPIDVGATWRNYDLRLPANPTNEPIEIRSATFDGGNDRTLGILVDWAEVTALPK